MRQLWITGTALALLMAANLGRADEAAAVKVIAKAGGTIIVDDKQAEKPVVGVIMWGPGFHGGLLKEPKDLKSLHKLRIGGPWITDDGIKELSQLKSLQVLEVRSPKVTDGALKELQEALPNLTFRRAAPGEKPFDTWITIFDGKNLDGWHVSAKTGHSGTSKNKSGGRWVVEDGAMVGSQDIPGNGGIIITDKKFKNFEVVLEMNNDFGPDSGLFLRCNDKGQCYQAMIDYHANGNLMGIYGEGIGGQPNVANFNFLDKVTDIVGKRQVALSSCRCRRPTGRSSGSTANGTN